MLVRVYSFQNATLLEISCRGTIIFICVGKSQSYQASIQWRAIIAHQRFAGGWPMAARFILLFINFLRNTDTDTLSPLQNKLITTEALEGHFYLLLITYYLLLITYYLLLTTYHLLLTTYYLSYHLSPL